MSGKRRAAHLMSKNHARAMLLMLQVHSHNSFQCYTPTHEVLSLFTVISVAKINPLHQLYHCLESVMDISVGSTVQIKYYSE